MSACPCFSPARYIKTVLTSWTINMEHTYIEADSTQKSDLWTRLLGALWWSWTPILGSCGFLWLLLIKAMKALGGVFQDCPPRGALSLMVSIIIDNDPVKFTKVQGIKLTHMAPKTEECEGTKPGAEGWHQQSSANRRLNLFTANSSYAIFPCWKFCGALQKPVRVIVHFAQTDQDGKQTDFGKDQCCMYWEKCQPCFLVEQLVEVYSNYSMCKYVFLFMFCKAQVVM